MNKPVRTVDNQNFSLLTRLRFFAVAVLIIVAGLSLNVHQAEAANLGTFYLSFNSSTGYMEYLQPVGVPNGSAFSSNFMGPQNGRGGCSFGPKSGPTGTTIVVGPPNNGGCYARSSPPYDGDYMTDMPNGTYTWRVSDESNGDYYEDTFVWSSGVCTSGCPVPAPTNTTTRIIEMLPANGTTTSNLVTFFLHLYINPSDVGNIIKIAIDFSNIDQNVLLLGGTGLAPGDRQIFFGVATTTGDWYFATTTLLGEGNYRVHAIIQSCATLYGTCLIATDLGGLTGVYVEQSNQFIVGAPTFIGTISQQSFSAINDIYASTSATSTAALATTCNLFGGTFSISSCLAYLFIPDAGALNVAMTNFKNGFLTRVPWGYATRFFVLLSGTATSSLPAIQLTLPSSFPSGLAGVQVMNLDQWSAFSSTSLLSTATSSTGATVWDTVTPIWNTVVLFAFAVGVAHELIGFFGPGGGDPRTETDSISTPEVLPGGRKTGITHTTTRIRRYKK